MRELLESHGVVYAEQEAVWLVEAASGLSRGDLLIRGSGLSADAGRHALALAQRRAGGEPLQYVTGTAAFRRLELTVGPGVFIPRPETELVAERALARLPRHGSAVDVGTGSGAIALALAVERPDAFVFATESSPEALAYAARNTQRCNATVELYLCDLLSGLPQRLRGSVDVCVSNPPYVPVSERGALPVDVVEHEPHEALFAGDDGLETIRRLAREARGWLRAGGWLVLEVGERQTADVVAILRAEAFTQVAAHHDLAGRDRIVEGRA